MTDIYSPDSEGIRAAASSSRPSSLHTLSTVAEHRVIAIVRAPDGETAFAQSNALLVAGAGVVEISLTTPDALDAIRRCVRVHPSAVVGAGTVLDAASAVAAVRAGARLLVTPTLNADVIAAAGRYGVVVIPGCATPTEMLRAHELGAHAVKLFPARQWTPAAMADVREALPQLNIVPTGGVSIDSASQWLEAGALAVGIGSALTRAATDQMQKSLRVLRAVAEAINRPTAPAASTRPTELDREGGR
ncbi:MAG: bifunctional 4-hydroxy-2-oxoglutarate aldolase/2-dehydro-3-deoxy-phosphogluconate aldolase [Terracoccus sp.]